MLPHFIKSAVFRWDTEYFRCTLWTGCIMDVPIQEIPEADRLYDRSKWCMPKAAWNAFDLFMYRNHAYSRIARKHSAIANQSMATASQAASRRHEG